MRKKVNLGPRMERCAQWLVEQPEDYRGRWRTLLPGATALHLELGCGKGRFTCEMAEQNPTVLFVAIERVADAMIIALERAQSMALQNVFFVDGDAVLLPRYFEEDEVDCIYLNFSDPWPTSHFAKRRLTFPTFLARYSKVMKLGGTIEMKTDNHDLFSWSLFQFPKCGYTLSEVTRNLHEHGVVGVMTDYEEKFHGQGLPINRCVATKTAALPPEILLEKPRKETRIESGAQPPEG
ncbi:MAG: tRNA (guanosine(46)-N7)-methyltransferase TrmB [Oscillospiraceae bacterium]